MSATGPGANATAGTVNLPAGYTYDDVMMVHMFMDRGQLIPPAFERGSGVDSYTYNSLATPARIAVLTNSTFTRTGSLTWRIWFALRV